MLDEIFPIHLLFIVIKCLEQPENVKSHLQSKVLKEGKKSCCE